MVFTYQQLIYFCLVWGFSPLSVMSSSEKISSKRGRQPPESEVALVYLLSPKVKILPLALPRKLTVAAAF